MPDTGNLWVVWEPGEEWPTLYKSRNEAIEHADLLARKFIGQTIAIYKLQTAGSISYPNNPTISGIANQRE